jgi:hypothetical protein
MVYVGHEYTQANLAFAQWVEPTNAATAARVAEVRRLRSATPLPLATTPTSLALELETNPFLRVATYAGDADCVVQRCARGETPPTRVATTDAVMTYLRSLKDARRHLSDTADTSVNDGGDGGGDVNAAEEDAPLLQSARKRSAL